jgi:hypothetical protein
MTGPLDWAEANWLEVEPMIRASTKRATLALIQTPFVSIFSLLLSVIDWDEFSLAWWEIKAI